MCEKQPYEKGQILSVSDFEPTLELPKGQQVLVLETPATLPPFLSAYMIQPLSEEAQRKGYLVTPGASIPKARFEETPFEVVTKLDDLRWSYFQNLGSSLSDLVVANPKLREYVPVIIV